MIKNKKVTHVYSDTRFSEIAARVLVCPRPSAKAAVPLVMINNQLVEAANLLAIYADPLARSAKPSIRVKSPLASVTKPLAGDTSVTSMSATQLNNKQFSNI